MFKKLLKPALCSLLLFSLLVTSTVAWLSINKEVSSGNIGITITPVNDLTTISCYSLQFDGIYGVACYRIGEGNGEITELTMTEFDKIFRDRNVNTPIIFVCELANIPKESDSYIGVRIPCDEKYIKPDDGDATNSYVNTNGPYDIQRFISNVIGIRIGCGPELSVPLQVGNNERVESNIEVFNSAHNAFMDNDDSPYNTIGVVSGPEATQFSHVSKDGATITYTKDNVLEIKLPQSTYSGCVYEKEDEDGAVSDHLMFYIQFDYDNNLMDYFIDSILNSDEQNASFISDLGIIQLINGKE